MLIYYIKLDKWEHVDISDGLSGNNINDIVYFNDILYIATSQGLSRLSKIIYPNKISNIKISTKAIRSGIILSSYKNNESMNLIDFFKEYPNKNIAIDLNALNKALEKAESLKELIDFYSNSPFQKLKDGRSST